MKNHRLKVLLIEDDEDDYILIRDLLSDIPTSRYHLEWAKTYNDALESIDRCRHDVYLLDYRLGEYSGLDLLYEVIERDCRAPVILLTGQGDYEVDLEAMKAGAADYLPKDQISAPLLERSIRYALEHKRTEEQLRKAREGLEKRVEERTQELSRANSSLTQEIEERKRIEDALRESEERYRTVMEANPDPVIVYDMDGKIIYFNPAFTRVFGWALDEHLGKKTDIFVPEENWPEIRVVLEKVMAGESFSGIETRLYTQKGDIIPVSISAAVYRDRDGKPAGSVINLRDISEQKKLEAELLHAQKMEAIGTLAGGIAHDFNNLLQAVQGFTELLLLSRRKEDPGYRELQEILRAARRGAELTRQLLTFSRKVESKQRPVNLKVEVEKIKEILARTIPKMIEIELHPEKELKAVNADPVQIEQVLMNLAVNAKDAMPEGGKLIIGAENVVVSEENSRIQAGIKPGDYVLLTVADTGRGMDQETLEHIFEPFFTTKGLAAGTGLGLAMVYGIVKDHGGHIMCSSKPGKGTTFKIYLPAIEQEVIPEKEAESDLPKGGNETILLVDDEEFIRNLGKQILERFGYTVLTASDGGSALELYREEIKNIDLVILDLIMPGMSGKRCLHELLKTNPQARILIASGVSDMEPVRELIEAGAKSFISKPYEIKQVLREVREVLDEEEV